MSSAENQLKEVKAQLENLAATLAQTRQDQAEREPFIADQAVERALGGVHELFFHEDVYPNLPANVVPPDDWAGLPFARFAMYRDSGDNSVGIPSRSYWALGEDQSGTALVGIVEQMLRMHALLRESAKQLRLAGNNEAKSDDLHQTAEVIEKLVYEAPVQSPENFLELTDQPL